LGFPLWPYVHFFASYSNGIMEMILNPCISLIQSI
jgi:hypothetical protein